MPGLHVHRKHRLGLAKARALARSWAGEAEQRLGIACRFVEDADGDHVHFERGGVRGTLRVSSDHFELKAQLGLLLGAFAASIQREIEKQIDALLAQRAAAADGPADADVDAPAEGAAAPAKRRGRPSAARDAGTMPRPPKT